MLTSIFYIVPCIAFTLYNVYTYLKLPQQSLHKVERILHPNGQPAVIGHRAGQDEAPENTLIAIETAYKNGATAVEVDVEFSKDGVAILHHDDTVDRLTDASGPVNNYLFSDLQTLNAAHKIDFTMTRGVKKHIEFETIPSLISALELCMKHNISVNLDIKSDSDKIISFLKALIKTHPHSSESIFITSFNPFLVYKVQNKCPEFASGLIWRDNWASRTMTGTPYFNSTFITCILDAISYLYIQLIHTWLIDLLGVSVVSVYKDLVDEESIKYWKERNIEVVVWTVNEQKEKAFFLERNVPIISDSCI